MHQHSHMVPRSPLDEVNCRVPTMAPCINCDMSHFTSPPPPNATHKLESFLEEDYGMRGEGAFLG